MIAFFDTNIYIDYLKGIFPKKSYEGYFERYIVRICPVVYQELIRCIRSGRLHNRVEELTEKVLFLPPPTSRMWTRAGELAAKVAGSYDERSLERIQNDLLIALTARENGATLITGDHAFRVIQRFVPFHLILEEHQLTDTQVKRFWKRIHKPPK